MTAASVATTATVTTKTMTVMTITIICNSTAAAAAAAAAAGSDGTSIPGLCSRLWPTGYWRVPRPLCANEPPTAVEQNRMHCGGSVPGGSRETHAAYAPTADRRRRFLCNVYSVAIAIYPPLAFGRVLEVYRNDWSFKIFILEKPNNI